MSYRTYGAFYLPNTKKELIDMLMKSKRWTGTRSSLQNMEKKQIKAIFIRFRQEDLQNLMRKDSINTNTKTEVKNE